MLGMIHANLSLWDSYKKTRLRFLREKTTGFHLEEIQRDREEAQKSSRFERRRRHLLRDARFPHEITDISAGIGICIVAIKLPLRHAMAQLPDSGDAFVISRSRSCDSPLRLYLACASPPLFDPNITRKLLRTYSNSRANHRSTPVLRFRGANSSWNVILWPNRPQIASRISMYIHTRRLSLSQLPLVRVFFFKSFSFDSNVKRTRLNHCTKNRFILRMN